MQLNETQFGDGLHLLGYGDGAFRLSSDQVYEGALLIMPDGPIGVDLASTADIDDEMVALIKAAAADFDVILIGCGAQITPLPKPVREALDAAEIPYDLMDTGAACRTFNVLLAEKRRVAALLIAMD